MTLPDPDVIDQAEDSIDGWNNSHGYPLSGAEPSLLAQWLADAGLLADPCVDMERDAAEAEQDRLADIIKGLYETIDDERATIRRLVRERMEARASLHRVREALDRACCPGPPPRRRITAPAYQAAADYIRAALDGEAQS